jgi:Na+/H+ antiporter NhaD/arsenite permease-like protein
MLFVPPSREYVGYFDFKTLVCLFSMLMIVRALAEIDFFDALAGRILRQFHNLRTAVFALALTTLAASMFITNDMALIAFLPLGYFILKGAGALGQLAFVFLIQTMAANLGGMLTPFGNPQNLYLYSYYQIPTMEFIQTMLLPFAVSVFLTIVCCLFVPPTPVGRQSAYKPFAAHKTWIYIVLLAVVVAAILRILPYPTVLLAAAVVACMDRKALKNADYPLIGTFCAFFIFAGNMSRIPEISALLSRPMDKNTLLTGVVTSQVISNVPAAILLSKFTDNADLLLTAVNVGSIGTPIASLASLITIRSFLQYEPTGAGKFMKWFFILNILFLAVLLAVCS